MGYDIIYYIFAVIIIFTSLVIAFSKDIKRSAYSVFLCLIAVSGLYALLYSELFALINIVLVSAIGLIIFITSPNIQPYLVNEQPPDKAPIAPLIVISLLAAIVSSIASTTRWQKFEIDYNFNSNLFVFTKYLPVVILTAIISSVIIFSASFILKKKEQS